MPYQGEVADKTSHGDIIQDPEVLEFLNQCDFLKPPSEQEGQAISSMFQKVSLPEDIVLPSKIVAFDGSNYTANISEQLPSTEVGYVKISSILIKLGEYKALGANKFVNPFEVAALQDKRDSLKFVLPGANVRWKDCDTVRSSFRAVLDNHLISNKTRFQASDHFTSLRSTLFNLAHLRPKEMNTDSTEKLKIHKCPTCNFEGDNGVKIELTDFFEEQKCPKCQSLLYPSDCLRLWEEIEDFQSSSPVMARFMQAVEHLLPIHYIRHLANTSLPSLGDIAFFIDRPLAVFGTAAWLHGVIMDYLYEINQRLESIGKPPILIIGLQKTGQIVDHIALIEKYIKPNTIFAIPDEYRYKYITPGREASSSGFGSETYYGQDFIYKTDSGRTFTFALPYPFASKGGKVFHKQKIDLARYSNLDRALALINHFECDLYENAIIPIALAHRYTSISLEPGSTALTLLAQNSLGTSK
jgi:hypothetical protein